MTARPLPHLLHPFARPRATTEEFITITRGEGAIVYDDQGRRYVDALASLWYCNVGHGRPEIVAAIEKQLRTLENFHTFDRFANEPAERYSAAVAELAPMPGCRVFLTTSGSEAVETAVKLVRAAHRQLGRPERTIIVSRQPSYHGVTYAAMSATGIVDNHEGFAPLMPAMIRLPYDDLDAAEKVFTTHAPEVAAVIAEPVIGAGGVLPPPDGYLQGLRALCDEHEAFLILDEVICGFGRLGAWWGAQRYDVRPDLVTFAKGATSGYIPLGGVIVGPAARAGLERDPSFVLRHGHTYSGHAAACAGGLATIALTRAEGLLERADHIEERLSLGLCELSGHARIAEVRGDGAMWAVEFTTGCARQIRDLLLERGVIARPLGDAVLALCPPLVIEDADLDHCLAALADALEQLGEEGT